MKTKLLSLLIFFLLYVHIKLYAQCEVNISGKPCKGSLLTANVNGGSLTALTWKLNGDTLPADGILRFGTTIAGGNGEGSGADQLDEPSGVFVDNKGNIWIADTHNKRIQKFTSGSENGLTIGADFPNAPQTPTNLFVSNNGTVYVADYNASRVKKLTAKGKIWVDVAGANNEMQLTRGVWVDKDWNVYATDEGNNRVLKYAPNSSAGVVVAGGNGYGSALNQLAKPVSVVVDKANNVYVTEEDNRRVIKWLPDATEGIIVAGNYNTSDSFFQNKDRGSVHDPLYGFVSAGNDDGETNKAPVKIYISDKQQNEVQLWYEGDTSGVTIAGGKGKGDGASQLNKPFANYVSGNYLFVADHDNARIQRFSLALNPAISYFVADKPGTYTAAATFSNGCKAVSNAIQVSKDCNQSAAGISNISAGKMSAEHAVIVFPNPAKNIITIQFFVNEPGRYNLKLTEPGGKTLLYKEVNAQAGFNSTILDINHFLKGIYFITVTGLHAKQQIINLYKQ